MRHLFTHQNKLTRKKRTRPIWSTQTLVQPRPLLTTVVISVRRHRAQPHWKDTNGGNPRLLVAQPVQITSNRRLHQAAVLFSKSRHRPGLSRTSSECQRVRITITQAMAKQMPAQRVATGETLKPCSSQNFSVDQQYYYSRNKQFPWEIWKIAFSCVSCAYCLLGESSTL